MSAFAATQSGTVTAAATSTAIAGDNAGRSEITVVNDDAAQIVYLKLATARGVAPTAVVGQGVRLNAAGGSWSSNRWKGAVAAIASGAGAALTISEF